MSSRYLRKALKKQEEVEIEEVDISSPVVKKQNLVKSLIVKVRVLIVF
jgi:hypothetical protein